MVTQCIGTIAYGDALILQERLVADVQSGAAEETLLLLEHPPVYTMGRSGSDGSLLDPSIQVARINRGGDVTHHGPGQLVGYPIVNLGLRGKDLRQYLRFLEELIMQVVAESGIESYRSSGRTGVWTSQGKLASIGVGVRRWVTMHGFALNICNDLSPFSRINPCGIAACPIASMEGLCGFQVPVPKVEALLARRFWQLLDQWLPLSKERGI